MDTLMKLPLKSSRVFTVKDVRPDVFIEKYAKHLKISGKMAYPKWADYVKTGCGKELSPSDPDWLYIRAASILRHLYVRPDTGIGAFRKVYSSKKRLGSRPSHSCKASGKIIRYILQNFEQMGLVQQDPERSGRRLTKDGQRELDTIARQCVA